MGSTSRSRSSRSAASPACAGEASQVATDASAYRRKAGYAGEASQVATDASAYRRMAGFGLRRFFSCPSCWHFLFGGINLYDG